MTRTISVRMDKRLEALIENFLKSTTLERSEGIRQLLQSGIYFQALTGFLEGKHSLAKAAALASVPLSEFMDQLARWGFTFRITPKDVAEGYAHLLKAASQK